MTMSDDDIEILIRRFIRAMDVERRRREYVSIEYFAEAMVAIT